MDARTEKNLATLLPIVAEKARLFLAAAQKELDQAGLVIKVISGSRTFAEQDALYAQGRTKPGPKVTNARGGYSNHNFAVAFDVGLFKDGAYVDDSKALNRQYGGWYRKIAPLAKSLGFEWGGDWKSFADEPHYQWPTGKTLAQMRELVAAGRSVI